MQVTSKADSYRRYNAGEFGNKLRTWNSLAELLKSDYTGRVVMRYKGGAGGAKYPRLGEQITIDEATAVIPAWKSAGAREDQIVYGEAAPDNALTIQGEIMLSEDHVSLFWSDEKTQMRKAMQSAQQWYGLRALSLLKIKLSPGSYDDIQILLEQFPTSVIEFSAYRYNLGSIPYRNTLIWEVRNY